MQINKSVNISCLSFLCPRTLIDKWKLGSLFPVADYVRSIAPSWLGRKEVSGLAVPGGWLFILPIPNNSTISLFISVDKQEIPKTPDHAPSRTFYLYTVNVLAAARMLLHRCFKVMRGPPPRPHTAAPFISLPTLKEWPASLVSLLFPQSITNLIERRQFETKENK